jgi:hypothetical protein
MATVPLTPRPTATDRDEARRRVRSPLERLRGTIRRYVSLEGAAVAGLYLALWFWIGLLLDYGLFRAFTFDWVQATPWGFRAGVLIAVLAGLLAALSLTVLARLLREFRDAALALVLERRFPELLGDRLITAVELSDTRRAAEQGYSVAMVEETVREAADRVEKVPLGEVFNWGRLVRRGVLVGLLAVGLYLVVGGAFALADSATDGRARLGGFSGLNHAAAIWFERNVLLRNTIWPRQAHLEFVRLRPGEGLVVGRDSQPPPLRVRALRYVIAGAPSRRATDAYRAWLEAKRKRESGSVGLVAGSLGCAAAEAADAARVDRFRREPDEGWRALTWFDLPDVLPGAVPAEALPADWDARDRGTGPTLDEIELRLDRPETHQTLGADTEAALREVLARLDARAGDPGMSRTLRKLRVPEAVYLLTRGPTTSGRTTLERAADNEFAGQFGELKEAGDLPWSFTFTVQGEDYFTAPRPLTVVVPPALLRLESHERRPAYLYYRVAPGRLADLRGRKQAFEPRDVLDRSGNDVSRVEVPAGTDVTLEAQAGKDLRDVKLLPRKAGGVVKGEIEQTGAASFTAFFPDVRQEQQVVFEMHDTEGVVGVRAVVLRPKDDFPPDANVEVRVIRKAKEGYMVTPQARVPMAGDVRDENGLAAVRYAYTVERAESGASTLAALPPLVATHLVPTGSGGPDHLAVAANLALEAWQRGKKPAEPARAVRYEPLPRFERDAAGQMTDFALAADKLDQPQKLPYHNLLKVFKIQPDEWARADEEPGWDFPLWKANLKAPEGLTQGRYKMQLWLEAVDTDVDSERDKGGGPRPHVGPSKEKFTFVIVSETELLAEIGKDEEKLFDELQKVVNDLVETEARLIQTTLDLSRESLKEQDLGPMSVRAEQTDRVLEKGQVDSKAVEVRYGELLKELKTNRVDDKMIQRVEKQIVGPLGDIADVEFQRTRDAVAAYRSALEGGGATLEVKKAAALAEGAKAKAQVRQLIVALQQVLGSMKGLIEVNELIKQLRDIEETEQRQADLVGELKRRLEDDLLKSATEGTKPAPKKEEKKP